MDVDTCENRNLGEEAEAIDICREAARLGSSEAQAQIAEWLVTRSLPKKKPADAAKAQQYAMILRNEKTPHGNLPMQVLKVSVRPQQTNK